MKNGKQAAQVLRAGFTCRPSQLWLNERGVSTTSPSLSAPSICCVWARRALLQRGMTINRFIFLR